MAKPDDLEAVRTISAALSGFSPEEQERILRWVREKVGLAPMARGVPEMRTGQTTAPVASPKPSETTNAVRETASAKDLKSFTGVKKPKSDVQFAAAVAYFYRFEAPPEQRKSEIDATILQDACRLAGRARLNNPLKTLNNAKSLGLLDSGSEKGKFTINTVGENLVAMTLPDQGGGAAKTKRAKDSTKKSLNKKK
jgi:hypothetical protein